MFTQHDVRAAIAECQGQRNPDANTCILLAALFTIDRELWGEDEAQNKPPDMSAYSFAAEPPNNIVEYDSGTEFSETIKGKPTDEVFSVIDELMQAVEVLQPRLYAATILKLKG